MIFNCNKLNNLILIKRKERKGKKIVEKGIKEKKEKIMEGKKKEGKKKKGRKRKKMKEGHLSIDLAPSINSTRPDIHNRKEKQEEKLAKIIIIRRMRGEE